jgi:hypothetical protein
MCDLDAQHHSADGSLQTLTVDSVVSNTTALLHSIHYASFPKNTVSAPAFDEREAKLILVLKALEAAPRPEPSPKARLHIRLVITPPSCASALLGTLQDMFSVPHAN